LIPHPTQAKEHPCLFKSITIDNDLKELIPPFDKLYPFSNYASKESEGNKRTKKTSFYTILITF